VSVPLGAPSSTRYAVSRPDSWLTFDARATLHSVHGKTGDLDGYIEASWNADGSLAEEPVPKMHVEFLVERLRSGNSLQDREMWKVIDSKRFPRIVAGLRTLAATLAPGRYAAAGDVTLAGRVRPYDGELTVAHDGPSVTIEGELAVDIRDFGIKPPTLFIMKVDPVVRVRLHLLARAA
jgi:hypothetical protein